MPNWAFGVVQIKGKKENVKDFIVKKFLATENYRPKEFNNIKFFARSFICGTYQSILKDFNSELGQVALDDECAYSFTAQFAWSAENCLIDGYPQRYTDECTDLPTACKEYKVDVTISTEEDGMGFEEHIICNRDGEIVLNSCLDMPQFECMNCGNEQFFPTQEEEYYCYECDKEGFANWKPC